MNDRINKEDGKSQALLELIVTSHPRMRDRANLLVGGLVLPAFLGRSGKRVLKREGDGATPVSRLGIQYGYYRADRVRLPQTRLAMQPIRPDMGWCDAPGHPAYNNPVRLPFAHGHEMMMRDDGLYDICLVLDWNRQSRRRHHGSAIFFHLHDRPGRPTEGCIAIDRRDMLRLLPMLSTKTRITVR